MISKPRIPPIKYLFLETNRPISDLKPIGIIFQRHQSVTITTNENINPKPKKDIYLSHLEFNSGLSSDSKQKIRISCIDNCCPLYSKRRPVS